MVHHKSELSLLVEVKYKQHLDLLFMQLQELVLGKLNELLSGGCSSVPREIMCTGC